MIELLCGKGNPLTMTDINNLQLDEVHRNCMERYDPSQEICPYCKKQMQYRPLPSTTSRVITYERGKIITYEVENHRYQFHCINHDCKEYRRRRQHTIYSILRLPHSPYSFGRLSRSGLISLRNRQNPSKLST